ncbi:MAG: NADH-quinone oxidoreductase subunit L [Elusimicrobia bacterium]|nr:NADH-quinone oxidoreductase subunit L [Elusimicrobiota bacterium]
MIKHVHWIALLPLIASVVILLGSRDNTEKSRLPLLGVAVMGWCLLHSLLILAGVLSGRAEVPFYRTLPWFEFGGFEMTLGVLIDGTAAFMLVVVTLVSFLVQVYSLGYMHADPRFKRYFAYLSFFSASMLGLVISSNLMALFACWELVGVSSYLLIGFWFEGDAPAYAGKKAFITTKLGDLGFFVGLLLLFAYAQTFDLKMLPLHFQMGPGHMPAWVPTAVGVLLLCGAAGKSAQVPLFVWLPDAMEGPTPVSALIHAATMVAAGVYLVARTYFIYQAAPMALEAVAWVGLITAALAATMAVAAYDIKRVLAFSTVSQLGFMMLGLGVGGYTSGLFHLTTHGCFKALLFLCAGSVIHAVHTNDMRQMGGLSKKMPETFITMLIGAFAIAGFPFLSGWFSKEAILHDVYRFSPAMWCAALATAALTAFYMFRLVFLTFLGISRDHPRWEHAGESPPVMTVPLWILAALSIFAGLALEHNGIFAGAVCFGPAAAAEGAEAVAHAPNWLAWGAVGAFALGLAAAWRLYGTGDLSLASSLKRSLAGVFDILEDRYGFDRFFLALVRASDSLAAALYWFDSNIIDAIFVDGWALATRALAEVQRFFDDFFVDGAVDGVGALTRDGGLGLSRLMAGKVQEYLLFVALAVSLFATFIMTR